MIRWIILMQAMIYLTIMPFLRSLGELGYHPPIAVGLIAIAAFVAGSFLVTHHNRVPTTPSSASSLEPRSQLWAAILVLSLIYDIVSVRFGLLNRRQGSEVMAEIYGTMPLWALAIIRGYELIFIPIIIIYLLAERIRRIDRLAIMLGVFLSLPFMGISDSRGRIVVIAMTVMAFFPVKRVARYMISNAKVLIALALVFMSFAYFSSVRANEYYSTRDYVQVEVFQRLDGLNISAQLREAHLMPYSGTWDTNVLAPLISKIPFLKAAQEAKLAGQTSSKQYYIQRVLKSNRLDDSNSMITDPLYYSGIVGLIIIFSIFGRCCMHFDLFVGYHPFYSARPKIALALAFCTSFITFEADLLGAVITTAQTWLVVYALLILGCRYGSATVKHGDRAIAPSLASI